MCVLLPVRLQSVERVQYSVAYKLLIFEIIWSGHSEVVYVQVVLKGNL